MTKMPRVGQLSLGLAFIMFGIALVAEVNGGSHWLEWVLRVWPSLLVVMGIEVLAAGFGPRRIEPLRLDIGSILVFLFVTAACGVAFLVREGVIVG